MFEKIGTGFLISISTIVVVALLAVISGTILYFIWPIAIPAAFPGLIASGAIAAKLSWLESICLTWIFGILIKSTISSNSSN